MPDADVKDGETVDLYVAMIKAIKKIEKYGELTKDDVEKIDHACWVWFSEKERKEEQ